MILADARLIRRAIENILRNALRYAAGGGMIHVSSSSAGGVAHLEIRDYGPGVPEEALPRLFDAFYSVDEHRSRAGGGVGLGLSIAKRAVALHGGTISARNGAPGLSVHIELPKSGSRLGEPNAE